MDSLFTDSTPSGLTSPPQPEGISLYGPQQGSFLHNFNAFYGLTHNVYDHELAGEVPIGGDSRDLQDSPYRDKKTGCEASWFLKQAPDPGENPEDVLAVDAGSKSALDAGLDQFTTCQHGDHDCGIVDIGLHHPSYLDLQATDLYGTVAPSAELDPGAYVHYNVDDDNLNSTEDCDETLVHGESDLRELEIVVDDSVAAGTVLLSRSNAKAQVWKYFTKGGPEGGILTGGTYEKSWNLSDPAEREDFNSVKSSLYVEGSEVGVATLKAKYWRDDIDVEDTVKFTFLGATCGWQPDASRRLTLQGWFPNLVGCEWSVTYEATWSFNCIAWSVEIKNQWIWDEVDEFYGDNDEIFETSDFDAFYYEYGYTVTSNVHEAEILLYKDPTQAKPYNPEGITHGARVTGSDVTEGCDCGAGKWIMFESKCGGAERLEHRRYQLNSPGVYGTPYRYYKKM
jgi:hypothetical protein